MDLPLSKSDGRPYAAGSWKDFLKRLKERGLTGVEFVVSDDHEGVKKAVSELLTHAACQLCYVHFLRNGWTTCRERPTTTVCRSCAGSMTGAT